MIDPDEIQVLIPDDVGGLTLARVDSLAVTAGYGDLAD